MVTPTGTLDASPYEYVNPLGADSGDSLPPSFHALPDPDENGEKAIDSQYITVNTSPPAPPSPAPVNQNPISYI